VDGRGQGDVDPVAYPSLQALADSAMTVTRGNGLLESFLAQRRSAQARKLLRRANTDGPLLDIGCGTVPRFLLDVVAEQRAEDELVGLERFAPTVPRGSNIKLILGDAAGSPYLPFRSQTFGAVTMLAVLEHLPEASLQELTKEIGRVLRPGGSLVLTTPAGGTGVLLGLLAKIRFVSPVEIGEHEQLYSKDRLKRLLHESDFEAGTVRVGSFELGMNNWAMASKVP
jgi:SAM-dependent methyltransferase